MSALRTALLGTVLLAAAAAPALAQPAAPGPGPRAGRGPGAMFSQVDANKDGRVTWDEAWAFIQERFNAADPDHDGSLTQQEMAAARLGPGRRAEGPPGPQRERFVGMMFRAVDANRDGVVTLDEIRPMAEARFRAFDANNDGAVTRDEIPAPSRHRQHHRGPGGQPPAPAQRG
jgi:Ca2+-binding EF-hand superfamily protein